MGQEQTSIGYLASVAEKHRKAVAKSELANLRQVYPQALEGDLRRIAERSAVCPRCGGFPNCVCK